MATRRSAPGAHWITVGGHPSPSGKRLHVDGVHVLVSGGHVLSAHLPQPVAPEQELSPAERRRRLQAHRKVTRELEASLRRLDKDAESYGRLAHREQQAGRAAEYSRLLADVRRVTGGKGVRTERREEVRLGLPSAAKGKRGMPLDEVAAELGYSSEEALRAALDAARRSRKGGTSLERHVAQALEHVRAGEEYRATAAVLAVMRQQVPPAPAGKTKPQQRGRKVTAAT